MLTSIEGVYAIFSGEYVPIVFVGASKGEAKIQFGIFFKFYISKALPMVTIMLGSPNGTKNHADILTLCDGVDESRRISVDLNDLHPGLPK